jgi:hypothetical protein
MALHARLQRALLRQGLWVALACGLVAGIWQLGAPARAAARYTASAPGLTTLFGGPRRPPRTLRLAFGSPEGRATLLEGFAATAPSVAPAGVELKEKRGLLQVSLAPDASGVELVVLGSASARAGVAVRVNATAAGTLSLGPEPTLQRLLLPAPALVADRNRIELVRTDAAGGTITLLAAWLGSPSMEATSSLAHAPPTALRGGWSEPEDFDGRRVRRLRSQASVALELQPAPGDYVLVLQGRSAASEDKSLELGVSLSGRHLAEQHVAANFQSAFLPVDAFRLTRPLSSIDLLPLQSAAGDLLIERVGLSPLLPERMLDLGRDASRAFLGSGFSFDEVSGDRDGVWSEGPKSRLYLLMDPSREEYVLTLAAKAFHGVAPLAVSVELNQKPLGSISLGPAFAIHELPVPRDGLEHGASELVFSYAETQAPLRSELGSTDARELGMFLDWVELRPSSRGRSLSTLGAR